MLDFSLGMPGSIATMIMSDFGAEVIKVEPPGGDPFRDWPGAVQWNRGKKSVILDLKTSEGRSKAQHLSRQCDVVVENFRPGATERLGIDYETLSAGRPDLVYCSLTGFGPKGPYARYKGYEGVVAAKSGRMMVFAGQNGRQGPNYAAVSIASHSAAMALVRGAIAALLVRDRTGQGQKVETSLIQTISTYDHTDWIIGQMRIKDAENYAEDRCVPTGPATIGNLATRTKDGHWLHLVNSVERLFHAMVHAMDLDYIYEDPRFKTAPFLMGEDGLVLKELMLQRMQEKTLDEWMDIFVNQTSNVAAEPYMTSQEGMNHPQAVHNGHAVDIDDPVLGRTRHLGPVTLMSDTPGRPKGPAPAPGQHTQEVLSPLNGSVRKAPASASNPLPRYPLEGITVLDLATVIVGPLGCSLLAELGARVIRIEPPKGDTQRYTECGLRVHRTMAGTEGMCLNLKASEGREILHKLVAKADILLHNMRPGAPERVGIGYEQVRKINPKLVYVYAAGYGSTGPHSHRPAMAPVSGAICGGALTQLGRDSLPPPEQDMTLEEIKEMSRKLDRANDVSADHNASMVVSVAMLLGLYARERTGKAQYLEPTMLGGNAYVNADDFFWYDGKPSRMLPDPEGYGLHALYRLYPVQRGWVFLACPFEKEWQALCRTIGHPDFLTDPRFATPEARQQNDASLAQELGRIFATKGPLDWEHLLTNADVACVRVEDRGMYHFYNEDPQVLENGFITEVEAPRLGTFWRHSPVIRFSHTQGKAGSGVLKGQHTRPILKELGYTEEEMASLREREVVSWEES